MAVNLTDKVHIVRADIPTKNLGSSLLNSGRDSVAVSEIIGSAIETGLHAPEVAFLGTGGFSQVTYNEQYGSYVVVNGIVTFNYKIVISSFSIAKQTGTVLIPYVTLPFTIAPGFDNFVQPLVHTVGQWQGNAKEEFTGGPGVVAAGACWTFQEAANPKYSKKLTDTMLITIPSGDVDSLIFTGTVSYLKTN